MKPGSMGKQIQYLRSRANMTKRMLCDGLCSDQKLFMIEEEAQIDMLLFVSLLERLGKSDERLAYILTAEEYRRVTLRDRMEEALRFGRPLEAKRIFWEYCRENPAGRNRFLRMYEEKLRGILALEEYMRNGRKDFAGGEKHQAAKLETAAVHFMKAIKLTISFPQLCNGELARKLDGGEKLLAMSEIENILLYLYVKDLGGKCEEPIGLLPALYRYLIKNMGNNELGAQFLAKTGMLLGERYLEKGDFLACAEMHRKILDINREYGMLVCVQPLLEQMSIACQGLGDHKGAEYYNLHKENLEALFGEFQIPVDSVNKLYYTFRSRQCFAEGEIIAAERKWRGMSQEVMIEDIYMNVENLSRIEHGKGNSGRKKFSQMMERLGIDRARCNGNLATDEYLVLELERDVEKLLAGGQYREAAHELYMLEKSVDMTEKSNRQLVLGMKNERAFYSGEISGEEALAEAKKLLELTYHLDNVENGGDRYRRLPFWNEMYLFNQVCTFMNRCGKAEDALAMTERMMRTYGRTEENRRFHFKNMHLCAVNLCSCFVGMGQLEEAKNHADAVVREELGLGKVTALHRMLAVKFEIAGKTGKSAEYDIKWLQQACRISEWGKFWEDGERLREVLGRIQGIREDSV
ncbi:MAG: helix-turn-helix domain-containing protein [Lachnospiraceae bacterium]|nr:helix-turn-helix domain-containing protein [Lachnospiraceae bacterium]